jgi:hypothetical protein
MARGIPPRRVLTALLLAATLFLVPACGGSSDNSKDQLGGGTASPTSTFQRQKLAKTRFVANVALAAGATYQWIVKPYRAGKFKKHADGRTFALVKAGLAGAFTYNRLKHALDNAKGDPTLSKAVAPLTTSVANLKQLPSKLRSGESPSEIVNDFKKNVDNMKSAGKDAGAEVKNNQVPSLSDLKSGS